MSNNIILITMFSALVFVLGAIQIFLSMKMRTKALFFPIALLLISAVAAAVYLYPYEFKSYELIMLLAFSMPAILMFFLHLITRLVLKVRNHPEDDIPDGTISE